MWDSLKKILPCSILEPIGKFLDFDRFFELRLRSGKAICINYGGKIFYLGSKGLCENKDDAFISSSGLVNEVVVRATDYSLYAVNDQLKTGFLSLKGGVRIGICGEVVVEGGAVKTIKNFSGINIRIPHEVVGCGEKVYKECFKNGLNNVLVISPPGAGKTTILRDLARLLGLRVPKVNVLIVDERCEIAASFGGRSSMNVGEHSDVFVLSPKSFAFGAGIRTLAPDVIITDELASVDDATAVSYAVSAGVCVIASVHGKSVEDIKRKAGFSELVEGGVFDRFVVLSNRDGPGTIEKIVHNS
ncbi:MAG: hypothetical protein FWE13_04230 [Firmicutes bacterium]|nr:hypothetical protein [Bacillota bacterium]